MKWQGSPSPPRRRLRRACRPLSDRSWTLLLHGGARTVSPKQAAASRRGCLAAAWVGQRVLHGGGAALDAVEVIVRELEDDTTFNAGRGSVLNAAGEVEMDAAIKIGRAHV